MRSQLRQKAVDLRTNGRLSYGEIRKRLGVPKSTLSYWLREFPLSEEEILKLRQHGTCSIFVLGVARKREIMMAIKALLDLYKIYPVKGT